MKEYLNILLDPVLVLAQLGAGPVCSDSVMQCSAARGESKAKENHAFLYVLTNMTSRVLNQV